MNILSEWIFKQLRENQLKKLAEFSDEDLKALWDHYDGSNAPDGYDGEDIHMALNLRGLGAYCAV